MEEIIILNNEGQIKTFKELLIDLLNQENNKTNLFNLSLKAGLSHQYLYKTLNSNDVFFSKQAKIKILDALNCSEYIKNIYIDIAYNSKLWGETIKKHRKNKKYTQFELSALTNISPTSLISIEKGYKNTRYENRKIIAKVLDISDTYWRVL